MPCCGGNCGCGSGCNCGGGCKVYPDMETSIMGVTADKKSFAGSAMVVGTENGCKCGSSCSCGSCTCK